MDPSLPPPSPKLRLMCSYGGHIVPRPNHNSLFYAGGETRIVSVDRRTTAASISALTAHLSRSLFHNRPFHLKYQLPNEDLDSLISVVTDEDLANMLDEHDRITAPARIRLFLFPVKAESLGSSLLNPDSENWFSDALKNTRILNSADSGLLMGIGSDLDGPVEGGGKVGAESLVLETSSSFGSTGSSLSMSNSAPVGIVHFEDNGGLNLMDKKTRVPSSASIESENSVGSAVPPPKPGTFQEPLIQVSPEAPSFLIESENTVSDPSISVPMQSSIQVLGHPLSQQPDGKHMQHETPIVQGGLHYVPQYPGNPVPIPPYYHVYQIPIHQQQIPCSPNQQYPIYLVPVRTAEYHNMPMQYNYINSTTSSLPPLHPQTTVFSPPVAQKEVLGAQPVAESASKVHRSVPATTPLVSIPSNQGQLMTGFSEQQNSLEPVTTASVASSIQSSEFDEDIAYNQIYKSQPSAPKLPSQYQAVTKGVSMMLSESSVQLQPSHGKQLAAVHTL